MFAVAYEAFEGERQAVPLVRPFPFPKTKREAFRVVVGFM
jgi:hypothetical protein